MNKTTVRGSSLISPLGHNKTIHRSLFGETMEIVSINWFQITPMRFDFTIELEVKTGDFKGVRFLDQNRFIDRKTLNIILLEFFELLGKSPPDIIQNDLKDIVGKQFIGDVSTIKLNKGTFHKVSIQKYLEV